MPEDFQGYRRIFGGDHDELVKAIEQNSDCPTCHPQVQMDFVGPVAHMTVIHEKHCPTFDEGLNRAQRRAEARKRASEQN